VTDDRQKTDRATEEREGINKITCAKAIWPNNNDKTHDDK